VKAGIGKRELFEAYYFDEIYDVLRLRFELERVPDNPTEVEADDFF
jgi:hypothetical protein